MPVLLVVAILAFAVRVGEVVTGFRHLSGSAVAEEKAAEKPADKTASKDADAAPAAKEDAKSDDHAADANAVKGDKTAAAKTDDKAEKDDPSWPDPAEMDPDLAKVKTGLLKDLSDRRKQLDAREKQLSTREALLKAAESEIDQKYKEMTELRGQLQGLLKQQSEEETARITSLVKIYEGMKPGDAARIFNTLDLTVLMDVMTRMSERKSSPVLAAMDPDRARIVTLMMAQQKKLPDLPTLNGGTDETQP